MGLLGLGLVFWVLLFIVMTPLLVFVPALRDLCIWIWKVIGGIILFFLLGLSGLMGLIAIGHYTFCTTNC